MIPSDVNELLYREALLDLLRTARAFAHAVVVAVERARQVATEEPLALVVAAECRTAIQHALAVAPGMLPLFSKDDAYGVACDPADDLSGSTAAVDQSG